MTVLRRRRRRRSIRLLCRVEPRARGPPRARGGDACSRRRELLAERRESIDVVLLDVTSAPDDGLRRCSTSSAGRERRDRRRAASPAAIELGASASARPRDAVIVEAVRARRSSRGRSPARRSPNSLECRVRYRERHRRRPQPGRVRGAAPALPLRAVRGGPRRPGRREGDLRAGGDRRALRATSSRARSSTRCTRPRRQRRRRRARAALPAAQDVRGGLVAAELAEREDALENAILAARVAWQRRGDAAADRAGAARRAARVPRPRRARRAAGRRLGGVQPRAARAAPARRSARGGALRRAATRSAERGGEGDLAARARAARSPRRATAIDGRVERACATRWFDRLLGPERDDAAASCHVSYMRRLSPLEATYTKERAVEVCLRDARACSASTSTRTANIRLDLDDRPQKSPRACVIASDPPKVVHLITRAQGGLHDYQAFLHEAGHALHYAGCDPALPYTFRRLSRDHALTEIYSYILEAITREPELARRALRALRRGGGDERRGDDASSRRCSSAATSRSCQFELEFWSRFAEDGGTPDGYAERLTRRDGRALPRRRLPRPTWTPASTRPTTCARGSARRSCART